MVHQTKILDFFNLQRYYVYAVLRTGTEALRLGKQLNSLAKLSWK